MEMVSRSVTHVSARRKFQFCETKPMLPQAQETTTHLSAMTVYFCSAGLGVFFARPAAFRIPTLPAVPSSGSRPASSTYDFRETKPIFPQAQETTTHLSAMTIYFRKKK